MKLLDREKEIQQLIAILSHEPALVYFIYGPINSGKTVLINEVLYKLPDNYCVFYINFRGVETNKYEDFVRALFMIRDESLWDKLKSKMPPVVAAIEYTEQMLKKINSRIELPSEMIKLFLRKDKEEGVDVFYYLENLMKKLREKRKIPVIAFDEIQMIKEVEKNGPILHDLFNFFIRMTKETKLSHVFVITSDCLFIEEIYGNARLEGRSDYYLVDDLDKERAYKVYEEFGFENKNLIWDWIGGKIGDMVRLWAKKIKNMTEEEGLEAMLKDEVNRLKILIEEVRYGIRKINWKGVEILLEEKSLINVLEIFTKRDKVENITVDAPHRIFLVQENILFSNPVTGELKPQGRLIQKAIKEIIR